MSDINTINDKQKEKIRQMLINNVFEKQNIQYTESASTKITTQKNSVNTSNNIELQLKKDITFLLTQNYGNYFTAEKIKIMTEKIVNYIINEISNAAIL